MCSSNRFKSCAWAAAILCLAGSSLLAQSPELPPGSVQAKVRTACTECHDSRIILQQRLSKQTWSREVDKMIKWGAVVNSNDRNVFIDYLAINFPPDKATEPSQKAGLGRKK